MPASRVVTQLQQMAGEKALIRRVQSPFGGGGDRRLTFYELAPQGIQCAQAMIQDIAKINRVLVMAISRKDEDVLNKYAQSLRGGLETDVFESLDRLEHAFGKKTLVVKRNGTYLHRNS